MSSSRLTFSLAVALFVATLSSPASAQVTIESDLPAFEVSHLLTV